MKYPLSIVQDDEVAPWFAMSGQVTLPQILPASIATAVKTVPARLSVFRVGEGGMLDFVRAYDVDATGKTHYWMGIVGLD